MSALNWLGTSKDLEQINASELRPTDRQRVLHLTESLLADLLIDELESGRLDDCDEVAVRASYLLVDRLDMFTRYCDTMGYKCCGKWFTFKGHSSMKGLDMEFKGII